MRLLVELRLSRKLLLRGLRREMEALARPNPNPNPNPDPNPNPNPNPYLNPNPNPDQALALQPGACQAMRELQEVPSAFPFL